MKNHNFYYQHQGDLKQRLKASIDHTRLKELHKVRPWRHLLVVVRLAAMTLLCGWGLWQTAWPWLWVPAAIVQGFNILGFIILLHEWVHDSIFKLKHPRLTAILGGLYAFPSAISATQFKIWHLDHHNELGSSSDDPKRAHLSPKINRRWYKLLYCTPMLFWIYMRAAATEAACYTEADRRAIRRERVTNLALHLALVALMFWLGGGWVLLRVYLVPILLTFPGAFVLNRLGQHYYVNPEDPAGWSTLVDGNPVWHFLFLWSNFHIEHHYYPRVPCYNLKALNAALQPFFRENDVKSRGYLKILWGWFVLNRRAHTDWKLD